MKMLLGMNIYLEDHSVAKHMMFSFIVSTAMTDF